METNRDTLSDNANHSSFSETHKVGNVGIVANFVFPYICSFHVYLYQLMLVNVKLEICEDYTSWLQALLDHLIFNDKTKTKLAL